MLFVVIIIITPPTTTTNNLKITSLLVEGLEIKFLLHIEYTVNPLTRHSELYSLCFSSFPPYPSLHPKLVPSWHNPQTFMLHGETMIEGKPSPHSCGDIMLAWKETTNSVWWTPKLHHLVAQICMFCSWSSDLSKLSFTNMPGWLPGLNKFCPRGH